MMKKSLLFVAAAVATLAGCSKSVEEEILEPLAGRVVLLNARAEAADTKVSFTDDKTFGWQADDQIGIYAYNHDTDSKLYLTADFNGTAGDKQGKFALTLPEGNVDYYKVAWYPAVTNNAVWDDSGVLTLDFPAEIENADPSVLRMPMVAYFDDDAKEDLNFKNVGGLVKVTLKNVPAEAKYFKLTADKQLSGKMSLDATQLGEEGGVFVASATEGAKGVQYTLEGAAAEELVLYFPLPTGSFKFGFEVYGEGVTIYQQEVGTKENEITRGTILQMPAIELPDFVAYSLPGDYNDWDTTDAMTLDNGLYKKLGVTLDEKAGFKVFNPAANAWLGTSWGPVDAGYEVPVDGSNNITVNAAGTYDVYYDPEAEIVYVLAAGVTPHAWSVSGNLNSWGDTFLTASEDFDGWYVAENLSIAEDGELKFRQQGSWQYNLGAAAAVSADMVSSLSLVSGGSNIAIAAGTYDVYLQPELALAVFAPAGTAFPGASVGQTRYVTIQNAIDDHTDEDVVIIAAAGSHPGRIYLDGRVSLKAVTIQAPDGVANTAVVVQNVEDYNRCLTLRGITISGKGAMASAGGDPNWIPQLAEEGLYDNGYASAITVDANSTQPVTIENCIVKTNNETNLTALYVGSPVSAEIQVLASTFTCENQRFAQVYGGHVTIDGCTITDPYGSYTLRFGYEYDQASLRFSNNVITASATKSKGIQIFGSCAEGSTVVIGDPEQKLDNNKWTNVTTPYANDCSKQNNLSDYVDWGGSYPVAAKAFRFVSVWGHYGVAGQAGWANFVSGVEALDSDNDYTAIRNAAFDDEFVYVPRCIGDYDKIQIFKFKVSDGSYAGLVQRTQAPLDYMAASWVSPFPISCVRVIKNTDASLNGGKDILICTSLSEGSTQRVYAWENGVDAVPTRIASFDTDRRFGDRMSVEGTYQEGKLWFLSSLTEETAGMAAYINLNAAYTNPDTGAHAWNWVEGRGIMGMSAGVTGINEYITFNSSNYGLICGNQSEGVHLMDGLKEVALYPGLKRSYGFQAFEYQGAKFISFIHMGKGTNLPLITVIRGDASTLSGLKEALDTMDIVCQAPVCHEDLTDLTTTGVYATSNQADCSVRIINGEPYILAITRGGFRMVKLVFE